MLTLSSFDKILFVVASILVGVLLGLILWLIAFKLFQFIKRRRTRIRVRPYRRLRLDNIFRSRRSPFSKQRKIEKGVVFSLVTGFVAALINYLVYRDINLSAMVGFTTVFIILIPFLLYLNRREIEIRESLRKGFRIIKWLGREAVNVLRKIWQNNFLFAVFLGVITVALILLFNFLILPKIPKLSYWELAKVFFVVILFACVVIGGIITAAIKIYSDSKNKDGANRSIIRNIPSNQVWVLRNAWFSNPGEIENTEVTDNKGNKITVLKEKKAPTGYKAKPEGWRFYIPYLWIDMGLVNLAPKPRDPEDLTKINTSDNQTAEVDWQIETVIDDSIKFIVRAKDEKGRETFEDQKVKAILAHICSSKKQKELTAFKADDLKKTGKDVLEQFNQAIAMFGIKAISLDIKKIIMPEEIRDAAEYKTVTKQRLDAADNKGKELQKIIGKTGANPTVTVAADILRGGLTDLVELIESFKKKGGD